MPLVSSGCTHGRLFSETAVSSQNLRLMEAISSLKGNSSRKAVLGLRRLTTAIFHARSHNPFLPVFRSNSRRASVPTLPTTLTNTSLVARGLAIRSKQETDLKGYWHPAEASPNCVVTATEEWLEPWQSQGPGGPTSDIECCAEKDVVSLPEISPPHQRRHEELVKTTDQSLIYWQGTTDSGANFAVCARQPPNMKSKGKKTDLNIFHMLQTQLIPAKLETLTRTSTEWDLYKLFHCHDVTGDTYKTSLKHVDVVFPQPANMTRGLVAPVSKGPEATSTASLNIKELGISKRFFNNCNMKLDVQQGTCKRGTTKENVVQKLWTHRGQETKQLSKSSLCPYWEVEAKTLRGVNADITQSKEDDKNTGAIVKGLGGEQDMERMMKPLSIKCDKDNFDAVLSQVRVSFPADGVKTGLVGMLRSPRAENDSELQDGDEALDSCDHSIQWVKQNLSSDEIKLGCAFYKAKTGQRPEEAKTQEEKPTKSLKRPRAKVIYYDPVNTLPMKSQTRQAVIERLLRPLIRYRLPPRSKGSQSKPVHARKTVSNPRPTKEAAPLSTINLQLTCQVDLLETASLKPRPPPTQPKVLKGAQKPVGPGDSRENSENKRTDTLALEVLSESLKWPKDDHSNPEPCMKPRNISTPSVYSDGLTAVDEDIGHNEEKQRHVSINVQESKVKNKLDLSKTEKGVAGQSDHNQCSTLSTVLPLLSHCHSPSTNVQKTILGCDQLQNELSLFPVTDDLQKNVTRESEHRQPRLSTRPTPEDLTVDQVTVLATEQQNSVTLDLRKQRGHRKGEVTVPKLTSDSQIGTIRSTKDCPIPCSESSVSSSYYGSILDSKGCDATSELSATDSERNDQTNVDDKHEHEPGLHNPSLRCAQSPKQLVPAKSSSDCNKSESPVRCPMSTQEYLDSILASKPGHLGHTSEGMCRESKATGGKTVRFAETGPKILSYTSTPEIGLLNVSMDETKTDQEYLGRERSFPLASRSKSMVSEWISKIRRPPIFTAEHSLPDALENGKRNDCLARVQTECLHGDHCPKIVQPCVLNSAQTKGGFHFKQSQISCLPPRDHADLTDMLIEGESIPLLEEGQGKESAVIDAPVIQYGVCIKCACPAKTCMGLPAHAASESQPV